MSAVRWRAVVVCLAVVWLGLPGAALAQSTESPASDTSASSSPSASSSGSSSSSASESKNDERGLAVLAVLVAGAAAGALMWLVWGDRTNARNAQVKLARLGMTSTEGDTKVLAQASPSGAAVGAAAGVEPLKIVGPSGGVSVGAKSGEYVAKRGDSEVDASWTIDPPKVAGLVVSSTADHPRVQVEGIMAGKATLTATNALKPDPVTVTLDVADPAPSGSSATFLVLGAGVGAAVVALVSIGIAGGLAFVGKLNSETIAVILGAGVGAGAAAAAGRGSQTPVADASK